MIRRGMRTRRSLERAVYLRRRTVSQTGEGAYVEAWGQAVALRAVVWQAGGQRMVEMYGERTTYIKTMEYEGTETIALGDAVCVDVPGTADPDYVVIAADTTYSPKIYTLEARIHDH